MGGVMESSRGVMWARKRQPDDVAYGLALGHERFSPPELLTQAVAAEIDRARPQVGSLLLNVRSCLDSRLPLTNQQPKEQDNRSAPQNR